MVDFDEGSGMIQKDDLETRVARVEEKLDTLSASVDARFNAVDAAVLEQRQYTEFAYDRLLEAMTARFSGVDGRFDAVDTRFDAVDTRFEDVGKRFDRLERKLDQFIDLHLPPKPPPG